MKKKSKFLTFILSFVPGVGHIYLEQSIRGIIFLGAVAAVVTVGILSRIQELIVLIPFIWLISLVDSMVLADKINNNLSRVNGQYGDYTNMNRDNTSNNINNTPVDGNMTFNADNRKVITMVLSIIPGTGHMFIGLKKQGIQLMAIFFLSFYFTDLLRTSVFMILVPIIWFYSMFDVMDKVSTTGELKDDNIPFMSWTQNIGLDKNMRKIVGIGLVFVGSMLILDRVLLPEISKYCNLNIHEIRDYIRIVIVSTLFIFGGIKLILGSKN